MNLRLMTMVVLVSRGKSRPVRRALHPRARACVALLLAAIAGAIVLLPQPARRASAAEPGSEYELTVRLSDAAGKGVAGATVGRFVSGESGREPRWTFYPASTASDEHGVARLRMQRPSDRPVLLYALDKEHRLAGFGELPAGGKSLSVLITLVPACHVTGKLTSSELVAVGHPVEWTNVYLFRGQERPLSFKSTQQEFEFLLPPGQYKLWAYCPHLAEVEREIEVAPDQAELPIGVWDLPATRLARLFGKPAPELAQIKGWLGGEAVTLESLRGKVVALDFWGTWCGPCVAGVPAWMALDDDYRERGLVIIGVHDDSHETTKELTAGLQELIHQRWGGREMPYRVALDGGGSMKIEGTDATTRGATTAAYGITNFPTGVLIDRQGKIVGDFNPRNPQSLKTLHKLLGVEDSDEPAATADEPAWKQRFDAAYHLAPGETLKRIAPPLIAERAQYITRASRYRGGGIRIQPRLTLFDKGGSVTPRFDDEANLGYLLRSLAPAGLPDDVYQCPKELANLEVTGDWIIREQSTLAERLAALEQILNDELHHEIHFTPIKVEQEVIVASGRYDFHPLPGAEGSTGINLTADPADHVTERGGGSGSLDDFLDYLPTLLQRRVINQVESKPTEKLIYYQRDSAISDFRQPNPPKLDPLLENLAKQTGLEFRRERRRVEVWKVTSGRVPPVAANSRATGEPLAKRAAGGLAVRMRFHP